MRPPALPALLPALLLCALPARGEVQALLYVGTSWSFDSDVRVRRPDNTDVTFEGVSWEGRSFRPPLYYGVRLSYFFEDHPDWGLMLDFFHDKAYARTDEEHPAKGTRAGTRVEGLHPLSEELEGFNLSHGANQLTLVVLRRWNSCIGGGCTLEPLPYVGLGAGVLLPHVETKYRGKERGDYQFGGPAFQALAGLALPLAAHGLVFGEYKLSHARARVAIPEGTLETTLTTQHLVFGPGVRTE